jgi:hypothetical protein
MFYELPEFVIVNPPIVLEAEPMEVVGHAGRRPGSTSRYSLEVFFLILAYIVLVQLAMFWTQLFDYRNSSSHLRPR